MSCGRCCVMEPRLRAALRLDIFIEILLLRCWVNRSPWGCLPALENALFAQGACACEVYAAWVVYVGEAHRSPIMADTGKILITGATGNSEAQSSTTWLPPTLICGRWFTTSRRRDC
jgi:hypothetical protein